MLAVKGIQIEASALGMRILEGKPIIIDHDVNFREQKTLVEQVKYLQKILGIFYKEGGKFKNSNMRYDNNSKNQQSPLNENNPSQQKFYKTSSEIIRFILEKNQLPNDIEPKEIIQEIINQINEQGRQVYIHENGVFPSIQPLLFKLKQETKIIGSLHLLRWQDNILLVNQQGQQVSVLSELYQAEICYDFLAQVNWQIKLKKEFGDGYLQGLQEQHSLKSFEEYINGNQTLSLNRKCMFKLLKLEQKKSSVIQQQLIQQSNMQIEKVQIDLQQKSLSQEQQIELKRIMEEFETSNEARKQKQLQEMLQYYNRSLENYLQIFFERVYNFIKGFEQKPDDLIRPWQINAERVKYGWIQNLEVKPMNDLIEQLKDFVRKANNIRMTQTSAHFLQNKVKEIKEMQQKVLSGCQDTFIQNFGDTISQTTQNDPWWYEVKDAWLEEQFLGKLFIFWCNIPPFSDSLQCATRYLMLFHPKLVNDMVVKDGITFPLFIQFVYNKLAQLTYYKWENVEVYEPIMDIEEYQFYQETYDGLPFIKHCKSCGFTSTEPSVSIMGDVRHYILHSEKCQNLNVLNLSSK